MYDFISSHAWYVDGHLEAATTCGYGPFIGRYDCSELGVDLMATTIDWVNSMRRRFLRFKILSRTAIIPLPLQIALVC